MNDVMWPMGDKLPNGSALNDATTEALDKIVGKAFDEQGVMNAGLAIEERAGFTAKPEKWW
jgi:hypothetical protein